MKYTAFFLENKTEIMRRVLKKNLSIFMLPKYV